MSQKTKDTTSSPEEGTSWEKLLITVADLPNDIFPTVQIPENRYQPLAEHGTKRAYHAPGTAEDHIRGILGEFAVADLFHVPDCVDTCIYEYGDPGFDLSIGGFKIDVKTASSRVNNPRLLVDANSEILADVYILVQELSNRVYRVLGYAPAAVVEQAPICEFSGPISENRVRVVEQDQLAPLPLSMVKHLDSPPY